LIKKSRKFWENVLFYFTLNYFTHFGGSVCQYLYEKENGKKALIWRIFKENFSPNSSHFENFENSKMPIFSAQFQSVTKHIEFFFTNFHIWYIATSGWSRLWQITKLAMKTLLIWCALLIQWILLHLFLKVYSNYCYFWLILFRFSASSGLVEILLFC
jgi:hypothetical protein